MTFVLWRFCSVNPRPPSRHFLPALRSFRPPPLLFILCCVYSVGALSEQCTLPRPTTTTERERPKLRGKEKERTPPHSTVGSRAKTYTHFAFAENTEELFERKKEVGAPRF